MTIRRAGPDDGLALGALRLQQDRELGRRPREGFLDEYASFWREEATGHRGWLAEQADGRPVGCVVAVRIRRPPSLIAESRGEAWYLHQVVVTADMRRRGIGRGLIAAVQQDARDEGVRRILLSASDAGRPLFDAAGFTDPPQRVRWWSP